jgi:type IV pilus assembly protein PilC
MRFAYTARTPAGDAVRGDVSAPDAATARNELQRRALAITSLAPRSAWRTAGLRLARGSFSAYRLVFFRSLSTLIRAGVPLRRGLEVAMNRGGNAAFAGALREVLDGVDRGEPLSIAFARRPDLFPAAVVAMTAAGEAGGVLDEVLERVARLVEREDALRKSVVGALAYPLTVFCATCVLVLFLVLRIVPAFATLFAGLHVELPLSTRLLLAFGSAAASPAAAFAALALGIALAAAASAGTRTQRGRIVLDRLRLRLPVAGALLRKTIHARIAGLLGTLVRSGIELSAAIELAAEATWSPVHAGCLRRVAAALRDGDPLTPPLAATGVFDGMFVALVGIGEEAGMLDVILPKAAEYFEADVAATIATLASVVEPALILFLGAAVGTVVYSIYIPLYSLIGSIGQ